MLASFRIGPVTYTARAEYGPALVDLIAGAATSPPRLHEQEADLLAQMMGEHWNRQKNPNGSGWDELTWFSAELRFAGDPGQPLYETGDLFHSLQSQPTADGAQGGSELERAGVLNAGGSYDGPMMIPRQAGKRGSRMEATPHRADPSAPAHTPLDHWTIPERRFAWIDDEQAGRLLDLGFEVMFPRG